MTNVSRRALLSVAGSVALGGGLAGSHRTGHPAAAAAVDGSWSMENDVLRVVVRFAAGSLSITSVYNKTAAQEYQTVAAGRRLFTYDFNGSRSVSSNDGGWQLGTPSEVPIFMFTPQGTQNLGRQLLLPMTRTTPLPVTVTAIFELYEHRAGLRFKTLIRNDSATAKATIVNSVVMALGFANQPHTIHYVPVNRWKSTRGALSPQPADTSSMQKRAELPKQAITVYDGGHGWSLNPELNWKTQHGKGDRSDYMLPPFGALNVWSGIDHVRFQTNPAALQLTLFPNEEFEYLSANLTVFTGGAVEAKMAVAEHFRKRFRYNNTSTLFNINDWDWRGGPGRTLPTDYYYTTVIPKAVAAGFDMIMLDDLWNTSRDATTLADSLKPAVRSLAELSQAVTDHGMRFGLWFSLSGGSHNQGRDLADPVKLAEKRSQIESLMRSARLTHHMIDLTEYWQNETTTTHSHAGDNVYRKVLMCRRMVNGLVEKYPSYLPKLTSELDIWPSQSDRTNGLLHVAFNGWTTSGCGITGESLSLQTALVAFGHLPMESTYMNIGRLTGKMEDYYSYMAPRNVKFGQDPGNATHWPAPAVALMSAFNRWRKSPRVAALTTELFRPVYLGPSWENAAWDTAAGPYVWMYTDEARTRALVIATGAGGTATSVTVNLRWLDPGATYLVSDITLDDNGTHSYAFRGAFTGNQLRTPGFPINLSKNTSRGKAFWIERATGGSIQLGYADERVRSWTSQTVGADLILTLTGSANVKVAVIVADGDSNRGAVRGVTLNSQGTATTTVRPGDLGAPLT